jgi:hypothetical protein
MLAIEKQLVDSSRMVADLVTSQIGNDPKSFMEAVELMERNTYPLSMRASRVVYLVYCKYPEIIRPYLSSFVKTLRDTNVDGVKRSIFGMLVETSLSLSDDDIGELAELSFKFVNDSSEPITVRAYSIDMLLKIGKIYPEILIELIAVLESIYPESSVGLKKKCQKLLIKLKKENLSH